MQTRQLHFRATTQSNRILEKCGLTISVSEGSKTNLDSSRWTKFTFNRTASGAARYAQRGDSEIQVFRRVQNNAFVFFLLFLTADLQEQDGKSQHLPRLRIGCGGDYEICKHRACSGAIGADGWLALCWGSHRRCPMPGRVTLHFAQGTQQEGAQV